MFLFISSPICVRLPTDQPSQVGPCHSLVVIVKFFNSHLIVIFLQKTFTSLIHAHAGRTQSDAPERRAKRNVQMEIAC
ncbi:MAG: hypothetical protein KDA57_23750, partial [Planctomycetales bacterium]|nr:hypothetical protein [Planctomycetales bacterium]